MRNFWLRMMLSVVLFVAAHSAGAQDAKGAETFVRKLYTRYQTDKDFTPFADQATLQSLATPTLAALVKREGMLSSAAQDPSALDWDPIYGGQDSQGLRLIDVKIASAKPGQALATVRLRLPGGDHPTRHLVLLAVGNQWRVDNILGENGEGDVRTILTKSIASYTTPAKH